MTQQAFYFDATRCTGCKTCQMACKDYNNLGLGTTYRRVYEVANGETAKDENGYVSTTCSFYNVSLACCHCDDPECAHACPTGAMHKDAESGLVSVDAGKCIGCGYCHMACPYNAPMVDREKGHSVKCDGCADRIAQGHKPVCVESCPACALDFGDVADMAAKGERANIAPLPEARYTQPNLYVKPSANAKPASDMSVKVANSLEVS